MRKLTQEQVIERIRSVWGDKYSTERMVYINKRTKFTLICPEHGAWDTDLDKVMAEQELSEGDMPELKSNLNNHYLFR